MASIKLLHPAHGNFTADSAKVQAALIHTASMNTNDLREVVAGHVGYDPGQLDDCSWVEVVIIWIESGNHPFTVKEASHG